MNHFLTIDLVDESRESYGKREVRQANLFEILWIIILLFFFFVIWRNGHNISNYLKNLTKRKFEKLNNDEKNRLIANSWCNKCGQTEIVNCKEVYLKGESWLNGNCISCNQIISKKRIN